MHDINTTKSFTLFVDETSDMANKEQLTYCVRYVEFNQRKDLLRFVEVKDVSERTLADTILPSLQSMGVETKY